MLQEGEFERVGGTRTMKVDVRFVCATNRNLEEAVQKGEFRADLYYRISVVPIFLPPLRERKGDLALLASEFLKRFNHEQNVHLTLSDSAMEVLNECSFPGNIRELENCVYRTATLARANSIVDKDFSCRNDGCLSSVLWNGSRKSSSAGSIRRASRLCRSSPSRWPRRRLPRRLGLPSSGRRSRSRLRSQRLRPPPVLERKTVP